MVKELRPRTQNVSSRNRSNCDCPNRSLKLYLDIDETEKLQLVKCEKGKPRRRVEFLDTRTLIVH